MKIQNFKLLSGKLFLIALLLLSGTGLYAQTYVIASHTNSGNPGSINNQLDHSTSGWTVLTSGPQSTNIWSNALTIPFTFQFYGTNVTQARASHNGLLTFNTGALGTPANHNANLPSASLPDNTLAVFWDDFTTNPPTGNDDDVLYKLHGTAPFRQLWIKWSDFEYGSWNAAWFAVVLEESSNNIYFVDYNYQTTGGAQASATVGVQLNSTTAQQIVTSPSYVLNTGSQAIEDNDYFEFSPTVLIQNLPYANDFSTCSWPAGWTQWTLGCTYRWLYSNTANAGGTACEMKALRETGATNATARLILPPLNTTGMSQLYISFKHYFDDRGAGATISVRSSSNKSTWTTESWSAVSGNGNIGPATMNVVVANNVGTTTYLAFEISGSLGNGFDAWYIDDVYVEEYFPCTDPSALYAINLTPNSADIGWTENGTATQWDVEYGLQGFMPTGIPSFSTMNNPHTLGGLTNNTFYDFYVRSDCGNFQSNWIGPYTFKTPCAILSIPHTENFDASLSFPYCWVNDNPNVWSISTIWPGVSPPTGNHVFSDWNPSQQGIVYSPAFDGTMNNNLYVRFYHYWQSNRPNQAQDGYFYGSPDGGNTVYLIDEWHHNNPAVEEGWKEYNISAWADGASNIVFWWMVAHNNDWYWVWDDFTIQEGSWGTSGLWTGLVNTDWSNTGNWDDGMVPVITSDVVIPIGCPNYPVVDEMAVCNSLFIHDGASFTMTTGGNLSINLNVVVGQGNSGTFTMNDGFLDASILYIQNGSFCQVNGGSINLSADLYTGTGLSGEYEQNGGTVTVAGNYYGTFNSVTDINNGTLTFNNWFRSPAQVFSRGTVQISGGIINAQNTIAWGGFNFNGTLDGPANINIGGTYRNLAANWTMTNGVFNLTGTAGAGPHYFMAANFGAGNYGSAYELNINGAGKEFKSNAPTSISEYVVYDKLRVLAGKMNTNGDPGIRNNIFQVGNSMGVYDQGSVTMEVNISNTIANNLTIVSTASGTGSWIDNGKTTVNGTTMVDRYITGNQWHYVSSPLTNALSGVFLGSYLKAWDESTYTWGPYIYQTNTPLNVAQGYELYKSGSDKVFHYLGGTLNTGNKTAALTATDRNNNGGINWGDYEGWNFIGNPYPSAIDWNGTWTSSWVDPTVYIWDGVLGQYAEWNWFTGTGINKTDGTIPADQGFFVHANNFNPSLVIPQSARFHSSQAFYKSGEESGYMPELLSEDKPDGISDGNEYHSYVKVNQPGPKAMFGEIQPLVSNESGDLKSGIITENKLKLRVEGNGYSDETAIFFYADASESFDPMFDAFKLEGVAAAPQLYSKIGDCNISMNGLPLITAVTIVPVTVKVGPGENFVLNALHLESFDAGTHIYLEDTKTGDFFNLKAAPVYAFSQKQTDNPDRFRLHFTIEDNQNEESYKNSSASGPIQVYSYEKDVFVNTGGAGDAQVYVYDILGKVVASETVTGNMPHKFTISNVPGYYIIKVTALNQSHTQKVLIR